MGGRQSILGGGNRNRGQIHRVIVVFVWICCGRLAAAFRDRVNLEDLDRVCSPDGERAMIEQRNGSV